MEKTYKCHTFLKVSSNPKSVSPAERVKEFKDEPFTVSSGKLFCLACREELGLKKSVIDRHVRLSKKHPEPKKNLLEKQQSEQDIAETLQEYNSQEHTSGKSLPKNQQVYRIIKVVSTFLRTGVPLAKIELFRPILEDTGYRLSGRRGMSDLIPFIHQQEQSKVKEEIEGMKVGVIFDGTNRLGEAMAIIICFVDSQWSICQRLVCIQLLAKSLRGEEVARELLTVIQGKYSKANDSLLAIMRDLA